MLGSLVLHQQNNKVMHAYLKNFLIGFEKFKGKVLHSHSYKQPFEFQDKKVVVIGIGNSGGDISVELGKHAEKVCAIGCVTICYRR